MLLWCVFVVQAVQTGGRWLSLGWMVREDWLEHHAYAGFDVEWWSGW